MHCFSFDIETVPDVEFGRRFYDLDGLPDDEVATAMMFLTPGNGLSPFCTS